MDEARKSIMVVLSGFSHFHTLERQFLRPLHLRNLPVNPNVMSLLKTKKSFLFRRLFGIELCTWYFSLCVLSMAEAKSSKGETLATTAATAVVVVILFPECKMSYKLLKETWIQRLRTGSNFPRRPQTENAL